MKCPLNGKPCIYPKEINVTNVEQGKINHLYLCKECGSEYLKLPTENIVTQMTSTSEGIVHEITTSNAPELSSIKEEIFSPMEPEDTRENDIAKLEKKMKRAIKAEKYEEAAKLRDEIKNIKNTE